MSDTASDGRKHDFFMVDNAIIDHLGAKLGPYAGWVYVAIVRHVNQKTNVAFPGISTLSRKTGVSRRKVINCIKELESIGLVTVKRDKKEDKSNEVNHYRLMDVEQLVHHMHHPSAQDAPPLVHDAHPNNTKPNKTKDIAPPATQDDAPTLPDDPPAPQPNAGDNKKRRKSKKERPPKPEYWGDILVETAEAYNQPIPVATKLTEQFVGAAPGDEERGKYNCNPPAEPGQVQAFVRWYRRGHDGADLPEAAEIVYKWWYRFIREQTESAAREAELYADPADFEEPSLQATVTFA